MNNIRYKKILTGASADSIFLMIVKIVTILFGMVTTRIMAGHFSLTEYGTYSQVMLITGTVSSLTILGLMDGVNFFFCKEKNIEKRDTYISTIFLIQLIVGLASIIIILCCTIPISNYFKNDKLKYLIVFAALTPAFQNTVSLLQILFIAIGKARIIALRNLIISILKLFTVFIACFLFDNIALVLFCQMIMEVVQVIYFFLFLGKKNVHIEIKKFDKSLIREILSYCIPMAMYTIMLALNKDCDKFVVSYFSTTEDLAIYTNASKYLPFDIVMSSFCTILIPYITRFISTKTYEKVQNLYKTFLEVSIISTAALALGAINVAPELMEFLYTDKYVDYNFGVSVFIIYAIVDILRIFNITLILSAAGKTKTIMNIFIGAFLSNFILNIALYPVIGAKGPAIATLIVTLIQGVLILAYSSKQIQCSLFKLFDKKFVLLFLIESISISAFVLMIKRILALNGVSSIGILFVCFTLFVILILAFNAKRFLKDLSIINSLKE